MKISIEINQNFNNPEIATQAFNVVTSIKKLLIKQGIAQVVVRFAEMGGEQLASINGKVAAGIDEIIDFCQNLLEPNSLKIKEHLKTG